MDSQPSLPPPSLPISDITTPSWPRRAVKACASCRRDKIRCDGARPCGGCLKKGYTPDQCIDGCEHCRRARVRCEGGKPCSRCRENQFECVEEQGPIILRSESPSKLVVRSARSRANDRAKLACQNCRRDNKKCDDQRPCSRCVARSEECIHVGRGPKLVKLRCESCRQDNKRCEDIRPCKNCVEQGKECINMPRKGRGHGTRVKAACTNCRRDKIRCEGVRPCVTCVRKGYQCVDRACKSCTQQGLEARCTHRKAQDLGSSEDEEEHADRGPPRNDFQQSSSSSMALPHPPLPPMAYSSLNYGLPQYYPMHQPSMMHNHPLPPGPSGMYAPPERPTYYPVIDPQIDSPLRIVSSERFEPPPSSSQGAMRHP